MNRLFTITINPCFDVHVRIPAFFLGKENIATEVVREAGGKGINTSRALSKNGADGLAYVIVGAENREEYLRAIREAGVLYRDFTVPGRIRENITVHPESGVETRLSVNTFTVPEAAFEELSAAMLSDVSRGDYVSFSGRIPNGPSKERVFSFLQDLTRAGAHLVVDSASFTPEDLKILHPWFVKPNEEEAAWFLGRSPETPEEAAKAAERLVQDGIAETVMISLGKGGAAASNGLKTVVIRVPEIERPVSTIGAGDSVIAGLMAGSAAGLSFEEALRNAAAFGTAACLTPGTLPPEPEDIARIRNNIAVTAVQTS